MNKDYLHDLFIEEVRGALDIGVTEDFVNEKILEAQLGGDDGPVDLSAYAKQEEVTQLKSDLNDEVIARQTAIATETAERKAEIAVERERINQFTKLAEGSTTGDAELIDARIDVNGFSHENVGNHIRQSVTNIIDGTMLKNNSIDISKIKGVNSLEYYIIPKKSCNANNSEIRDSETQSLLWVNTKGKRFFRITNNGNPTYNIGYYWTADTLHGPLTRKYGLSQTGSVNNINANWALFNINGISDFNIVIESPSFDMNINRFNNEHLPNNMLVENKDIVVYGKTNFCIQDYATPLMDWKEIPTELSVAKAFEIENIDDSYYANYDVPCALVFSNDYQTYKGYQLNLGNSFKLNLINGIEKGDHVLVVSTNDNNIISRNNAVFKAPVTINNDYLNIETENANTWFYGKVGSGLGDSLTAITNNWRTIVEKQLGCIINNNGIGGSSMRGTSEQAMHQDIRINSIDTNADFIVIFAGSNDCYGYAPAPSDYSYDNTDVNTFIGAYNVCISKILYRFGYGALYNNVDYSGLTGILDTPKNVKVFLVTPPYQYRGENEDVSLSTALNSYKYANAVREIAKGWNLPLIDVNATCGINRVTYSEYLDDGVHPNTKGQFEIGNAVTNGLLMNTPRENG